EAVSARLRGSRRVGTGRVGAAALAAGDAPSLRYGEREVDLLCAGGAGGRAGGGRSEGRGDRDAFAWREGAVGGEGCAVASGLGAEVAGVQAAAWHHRGGALKLCGRRCGGADGRGRRRVGG